MTENTDRQLSLTEEAKADPVMSLDMAAARGVVDGSALLARTFRATGLTQRQLAMKTGVSEGRVSQVLGGEENLRLSTVSRYLHAMGYRLNLSATNLTDETTIYARRERTKRSSPAVRLTSKVPYSWLTSGKTWETSEPYLREDGTGRAPVFHIPVTIHMSYENPKNLESLLPIDTVAATRTKVTA